MRDMKVRLEVRGPGLNHEAGAKAITMTSVASFRHIFVLCTGRCGSMTFANACSHFTNYSAGHETRLRHLGEDRLNYPESHIEADNRLAWMLGRLDKRFGNDAFYVHLVRDPGKVADSYDRRWEWAGSIMRAYNFGILNLKSQTAGVARDMVDTITTNIEHFLKDKTNKIVIDIDDPQVAFREFALRIGAEGDIEAAIRAMAVKSNTSRQETASDQSGRSEIDFVQEELDNAAKKLRALKKESIGFKSRLTAAECQIETLERQKRQLTYLAIPTMVVGSPVLLPAWGLSRLWLKYRARGTAGKK